MDYSFHDGLSAGLLFARMNDPISKLTHNITKTDKDIVNWNIRGCYYTSRMSNRPQVIVTLTDGLAISWLGRRLPLPELLRCPYLEQLQFVPIRETRTTESITLIDRKQDYFRAAIAEMMKDRTDDPKSALIALFQSDLVPTYQDQIVQLFLGTEERHPVLKGAHDEETKEQTPDLFEPPINIPIPDRPLGPVDRSLDTVDNKYRSYMVRLIATFIDLALTDPNFIDRMNEKLVSITQSHARLVLTDITTMLTEAITRGEVDYAQLERVLRLPKITKTRTLLLKTGILEHNITDTRRRQLHQLTSILVNDLRSGHTPTVDVNALIQITRDLTEDLHLPDLELLASESSHPAIAVITGASTAVLDISSTRGAPGSSFPRAPMMLPSKDANLSELTVEQLREILVNLEEVAVTDRRFDDLRSKVAQRLADVTYDLYHSRLT